MTHKTNTKWKGGMAFEITSPGGNLMVDAAEDYGGEGRGLRPKPLMLDALGGCTAIDVASMLKKMRVEFDDLQIEVAGELTEEHPKHYTDVHITYRLYGKDINRDKVEKAVGLSVEKYCGVIYMFKAFAKVDYEIEYFED